MKKTFSFFLLAFLITFSSFGQDSYLNDFGNLSQKKIIAIGESAHSIEDFADWNINFFKELVQNGISTTFAVESDYSTSKNINRYIKGEIKVTHLDSLIDKSLYRVWRSPAMRDFVIWARNYNQSAEEENQINFIGFDSQWAYGAIDEIKFYLEKNLPDYEKYISSKGMGLLSQMGVSKNYNLKRLPDEERKLLVETIKDLNEFFESNVVSSELINLDLMVLNHAWEFENANPFNFTNIRDRNMFIMLEEITKSKSKPIVIWAHNGHISKSKLSFYKPIGYHLFKKYESDYLSIGLDFKNKSNSEVYMLIESRNWIANKVDFAQGDVQVIKMNNLGKSVIRNVGASKGLMKLKNDKQFDYIVYFEEVKK